MPTSKKRILVTLDDSDYDLLKRVAAINGQSMASILREYVEMSRPMLVHLAEVGEALRVAEKTRTQSHREAIQQVLQLVEPGITAKSGDLALDFAKLMNVMLVMAEGNPSTAPEAGGEGEPPSSNTGVRITNLNSKRVGGRS